MQFVWMSDVTDAKNKIPILFLDTQHIERNILESLKLTYHRTSKECHVVRDGPVIQCVVGNERPTSLRFTRVEVFNSRIHF